MTTATRRFSTADLESFPRPLDDTRYEIIDGELYVSAQPSYEHQYTCSEIVYALRAWREQGGTGVALIAPGVIFADDDNVAPDVVWISAEQLPHILGEDRKLHGAPNLIVEVLSPGSANARRDREAKLTLYSRRGVQEYWIVDGVRRQVEAYRRVDAPLHLAATLGGADLLKSPLLPGFSYRVDSLFPPADPQV